jgi:endonuclease-3 related protein
MRSLKPKPRRRSAARLLDVYRKLFRALGPQHWWPGDTDFEMAVGAILTQNTNWTNVEKAIRNLKERGLLSPERLPEVPEQELAELIRPSGYFRVKAKRLGEFLRWMRASSPGSLRRALSSRDATALRGELLRVNGIGPETADSILLYAGGLPVFVVDAYTRRVFARHGFLEAEAPYEEIRAVFESNLPRDPALYNEYHALIVRVGKEFCRTREPRCDACPLQALPRFLDRWPGKKRARANGAAR